MRVDDNLTGMIGYEPNIKGEVLPMHLDYLLRTVVTKWALMDSEPLISQGRSCHIVYSLSCDILLVFLIWS